jgi:hypothetical protein
MPHYVNIALGNFLWRAFLFVREGSSLLFLFSGVLVNGKDAGLRIVFVFSIEKEKAMCCKRAGQKA